MFASSLRKRPLPESLDDGTVDLDLDPIAFSSSANTAPVAASSSARIDLDEEPMVSAHAVDLDDADSASAQEQCAIDGARVHVGENASGKFYLFTVVTERGTARYKQPDAIGREGFFVALKSVYAEVYPDAEHTLHSGPLYGMVARELHANSNLERSRNPHLHCATAFATDHRWKTIERLLRERHEIKVLIQRHDNMYVPLGPLCSPRKRNPGFVV